MSSSCTLILMGVTPLVLEIPLPSKTAKFPFRPMGYSPWSSKNLIDRNRLKKFMQLGIYVKFMYIDFGGRDPSVSEIPLPSKKAKFPFRPMGYSPWSSKILIDRNRLKKFMQAGIYVKFLHIDFGGCDPFSFRDTTTLKNGHGHQKI